MTGSAASNGVDGYTILNHEAMEPENPYYPGIHPLNLRYLRRVEEGCTPTICLAGPASKSWEYAAT